MGIDEVATLQALKAHRRAVVDPTIAALKCGRTANAVFMTKYSKRHRRNQPIIIEA
jgi:hypothetical protein